MAVTNEDKGKPLLTASGDAVTGYKIIDQFRWTGATTAGHTLVINDSDGKLIAKSIADIANFETIIPLVGVSRYVNGFTVTMDSGHVEALYA